MITSSLLLGLLVFLGGIFLIARSSSRLIGKHLKQILSAWSKHPVNFFFTGILSAAIVQSSSAISSVGVAFAGSKVITASSALALALGASIGTTVTAQLISLPILEYGPALLAIGLVVIAWAKLTHNGGQLIGNSLIALGLIFIGLLMMSGSFSGDTQLLHERLAVVGNYPWLMFLTGILLTILVQSSSASIGLVLALVVGNVLTASEVMPFVLGAGIGTTITANLASLVVGQDGKRAARAFFIVMAAGMILFMLILPQYLSWIDSLNVSSGSEARLVANANTILHAAVALAAMPFIYRLIPTKQKRR